MSDLPDGWRRSQYSDLSFTGPTQEAEVDVDEDFLYVSWTEGADDHYGHAKRSIAIPVAVVRAALAALEVTP